VKIYQNYFFLQQLFFFAEREEGDNPIFSCQEKNEEAVK
jgi:hypothetical protein